MRTSPTRAPSSGHPIISHQPWVTTPRRPRTTRAGRRLQRQMLFSNRSKRRMVTTPTVKPSPPIHPLCHRHLHLLKHHYHHQHCPRHPRRNNRILSRSRASRVLELRHFSYPLRHRWSYQRSHRHPLLQRHRHPQCPPTDQPLARRSPSYRHHRTGRPTRLSLSSPRQAAAAARTNTP